MKWMLHMAASGGGSMSFLILARNYSCRFAGFNGIL